MFSRILDSCFRLGSRLKKNANGATMLEYAIIVGGIAIVGITAISAAGNQTRDTLSVSQTTLASALRPPPPPPPPKLKLSFIAGLQNVVVKGVATNNASPHYGSVLSIESDAFTRFDRLYKVGEGGSFYIYGEGVFSAASTAGWRLKCDADPREFPISSVAENASMTFNNGGGFLFTEGSTYECEILDT